MANIIDYIKWRGDLPFKTDPFNDIDGLALSLLVYVEFGEIINHKHHLKDVYNEFYQTNDVAALLKKFSFTKEAVTLLEVMAQSKRYQNILLFDYISELDYHEVKQFAAITFQLPDGSLFVSYRGTDDTLLGWQEDFMLTYQATIPSQLRAKEYLEMIAKKRYHYSFKKMLKNRNSSMNIFKASKEYFLQYLYGHKIRIGGHSKGGNLAVYAASNSNKKLVKRILTIYNNDGPGFDLNNSDLKMYNEITNKIIKIVPEGCVFGIMLDSLEKLHVVKSDARGMWQHSAFSWQIEGKTYIFVNSLNNDSLALIDTFKAWFTKVDNNTRKQAVESIFAILKATKITKIDDFSQKTFTHIFKGLKEINHLDNNSKEALINFFKILIIENNNSKKEYRKK